ncbi:MAG: hypothetical protein WCL44_15810 [bacterium]
MKIKTGLNDLLWMAAGAAVLLICLVIVFHFYNDQDAATQLARKIQRADRAGRMQLDLASAAEAEKSAVLAPTDEDSQLFADQARAATARVEQERQELSKLLPPNGSGREPELLAQFAIAFAEFQRIDNELLALAVRNTNLKASGLAFGPAATALKAMDGALARLPADDAQALRFATNARIAAWRLLTLIPPHIAEEDDNKEDALEALMATEDAQVQKNLADLAALPKFNNDPDLTSATARYAEFSKIKTRILTLSRENTNVRSLSISLNQKRKVMLVCQEVLGALQQAIQAEPIAGTSYGTAPVRPR